MKKIVVSFITFVLGFSVFAEGFFSGLSNNIGVGVSMPVEKFKVEDVETIGSVGVALNAMYLGICDNGFTLKGDLFGGAVFTDDLADGTTPGGFFAFDVGAGHSFIRNEKFTLSVTGLIGMDVTSFKFDVDPYPYVDANGADDLTANDTYTVSTVNMNVGADVTGIYHIKPNFGLYADISLRLLPLGKSYVELERNWEHSDGSSAGGPFTPKKYKTATGIVFFVPTIGVVWTL